MADEKLFAGKFKSVEELEEGYKQSFPVHQKNAELAKKLEEITKIPDDYNVAADIIDIDDVNELKSIARKAELTQEKFDKLAKEFHDKNQSQKTLIENERKSLGDEKVNLLNDYVSTHYPAELKDVVMNKLFSDKTARESAFKHREQLLSSKTPGIGTVAQQMPSITHDDVLKAGEDHFRDPNNMRLRDKYLNLTAQYANKT